MAIMRVNPTRMELKRLKNRLKTAERGHKLLKDKTDEMVRQFIIYANRNRRLRKELERELGDAMKNFVLARAVMSPCQAEEALVYPSRTVTLDCDKKSVMSVMVPSIKVSGGDGALYPYGFLSVTDEMDSSIATLNTLLVKLIELAEVEKNHQHAGGRNRKKQKAGQRAGTRYDSAAARNHQIYRAETRRKRKRLACAPHESQGYDCRTAMKKKQKKTA